MDTIYATTTITRTTTVELPNGATAELPWVMEHRDDVAVVELPDGGYRLGWLVWDEDATDPLDDWDCGERVELFHRWNYGGPDFDDARGWIESVGIGNGRRVFLVDEEGHIGRDWTNMRPRWVYTAPEDVPADRRAEYAEGVWAEWRAWARGENYGAVWVDVDADGTVRDGTYDSVWGITGDDYAAEALAEYMGVPTELVAS